jgi:hypothetical protein
MNMVLEEEQQNMKGFKQNIHKLTKEASTLSSVVNEWPTHFADAFSKCRIQRVAVDSIERSRNSTMDNKIKESLTMQLEKERAIEQQLSQQEQEWQKEGHRVQLETDQAASRLSQLIGKMQHTEQQFDQESGNFSDIKYSRESRLDFPVEDSKYRSSAGGQHLV